MGQPGKYFFLGAAKGGLGDAGCMGWVDRSEDAAVWNVAGANLLPLLAIAVVILVDLGGRYCLPVKKKYLSFERLFDNEYTTGEKKMDETVAGICSRCGDFVGRGLNLIVLGPLKCLGIWGSC